MVLSELLVRLRSVVRRFMFDYRVQRNRWKKQWISTRGNEEHLSRRRSWARNTAYDGSHMRYNYPIPKQLAPNPATVTVAG